MSFSFFPVVLHQVTFLIKSLTFPPIVCRTKSTHSRPDLVVDRITPFPWQSHEQFPEPMTMFLSKRITGFFIRERKRGGDQWWGQRSRVRRRCYMLGLKDRSHSTEWLFFSGRLEQTPVNLRWSPHSRPRTLPYLLSFYSVTVIKRPLQAKSNFGVKSSFDLQF